MPLADPYAQARRGPVRFSEQEIEALVAFVGPIGSGPDTPHIDTAAGDTSNGGILYRLNCAACHVASAAGAPIGKGREAPNLSKATPTQIGQAIVIGPGAMPGSARSRPTTSTMSRPHRGARAQNTTGPSKFGGAGPVARVSRRGCSACSRSSP